MSDGDRTYAYDCTNCQNSWADFFVSGPKLDEGCPYCGSFAFLYRLVRDEPEEDAA